MCPHDDTGLVPLDDSDDPLLGAVLEDRYRLDELLGSGGMGKVYRATQLAVDRDVAVKILRDQLSDSQEAHRRFSREARTISSLSHPNIVKLIDFGRDAEHEAWFLVMEHVEGESLGRLLEEGRLDHELAVEIVYQVCAGLSDPHARGMVHRDLKPENLHLTPVADGTLQVKVLDFGIARCVEQTTRMTRSGQICGTPAYVAPEQAAGSQVDIRADFFALGILFFEMLTGHLPFSADGPLQLMFKNAERQLPPLDEELADAGEVPVERLQNLLDDLVAKHPQDRPSSAAEIRTRIEDLRQALERPVHRLSDEFTSFEDLYAFVEPRHSDREPAEAGARGSNRGPEAFARTAGAYETVQPTVAPTDKRLDRADTPLAPRTERGVGEPTYASDLDRSATSPETEPDGAASRIQAPAESTTRPPDSRESDTGFSSRQLVYGVVGLSIAAVALGLVVSLVGEKAPGSADGPDDAPPQAESTSGSPTAASPPTDEPSGSAPSQASGDEAPAEARADTDAGDEPSRPLDDSEDESEPPAAEKPTARPSAAAPDDEAAPEDAPETDSPAGDTEKSGDDGDSSDPAEKPRPAEEERPSESSTGLAHSEPSNGADGEAPSSDEPGGDEADESGKPPPADPDSEDPGDTDHDEQAAGEEGDGGGEDDDLQRMLESGTLRNE